MDQQIGRSRSRGALTNVPGEWKSVNEFSCQVGPNFHGGPFTVARVGTTEIMVDEVTKNFRKRSQAGEVIIKPYWYRRETYTASGNHASSLSINPVTCISPSAFNLEELNGPWALQQSGLGTILEPPSLIQQSEIDAGTLAAANRAWGDAAGHDADILQDIAEYHQTISLLKSPTREANRLFTSIGRSRNGKLRLLGKLGNQASDLWLQYRFGVRPLVSTLDGVVKALARLQARHRWTARGNYTLQKSNVTPGTTLSWNVGWNWSRTDTHKVTVRAGILLEENLTLANNLGVDASGMLSLPWELVPFSFVADWFLSVGDFLKGLTPSLVKTPLGSWWTVNQELDSTYVVGNSFNNSPSTYNLTRGVSGKFTGKVVIKQRYLALPGPSIVFKPQSVSKVLSDLRTLDAATLVFQKLGSVFKG